MVSDEAVATEALSTFCAMEVLCPLPLREPLYDQFHQGRLRLQEIAQRFQAPEELVELIFSETYHALARPYLLAEPLQSWMNSTPSFVPRSRVDPQSFQPSVRPDRSMSYAAMRSRRRQRKRVGVSSVELLNQLYDERSS